MKILEKINFYELEQTMLTEDQYWIDFFDERYYPTSNEIRKCFEMNLARLRDGTGGIQNSCQFHQYTFTRNGGADDFSIFYLKKRLV